MKLLVSCVFLLASPFAQAQADDRSIDQLRTIAIEIIEQQFDPSIESLLKHNIRAITRLLEKTEIAAINADDASPSFARLREAVFLLNAPYHCVGGDKLPSAEDVLLKILRYAQLLGPPLIDPKIKEVQRRFAEQAAFIIYDAMVTVVHHRDTISSAREAVHNIFKKAIAETSEALKHVTEPALRLRLAFALDALTAGHQAGTSIEKYKSLLTAYRVTDLAVDCGIALSTSPSK